MGNHLEAPNEGDWGRAIVDGDFAEIAARGFETPISTRASSSRAGPMR
jgi:hypothetical protein